ncbi:helix-turn-helix transcriptional regulator [Acidocella sp. MX-AZ03]|uniref:helix-turn-helix transcriptional regulator n=1 Tax=Acidocella TaxID=50709 RepID=UPI0005576429|nr:MULTISPECIES: helix-turn-helix transcriptional regulator [Acidocella]WBO59965.1 helix-turn-helix transcriptional regulator [Acidocella sp. MX-AZ03]
MDHLPQRRELGAFIRARREALSPPPGGGRRRTPGLRREEAATRCALSPTLYTWIEQGRDISLTARTLASLAQGLSLTPAERAYLFALGQIRDPATPPKLPALAPVPAALQRALSAIAAPAYLLDARFTARAWNAPARALFAPWHESGEPNLLRFVFLVPAARDFIQDWAASARRLVAEFRAETAETPDDPRLHRLLDELRAQSPDFAKAWAARDVQARLGGLRRFNHPTQGALCFTQVNFQHLAGERYRLIMLIEPGEQG